MKGFGYDHESNLKSNKSKENSQERIINHAIQLHVRGDISEATKYYQNCIEQGIKDCRVFSNYGIILRVNKLVLSWIHTSSANNFTRKNIEKFYLIEQQFVEQYV